MRTWQHALLNGVERALKRRGVRKCAVRYSALDGVIPHQGVIGQTLDESSNRGGMRPGYQTHDKRAESQFASVEVKTTPYRSRNAELNPLETGFNI